MLLFNQSSSDLWSLKDFISKSEFDPWILSVVVRQERFYKLQIQNTNMQQKTENINKNVSLNKS